MVDGVNPEVRLEIKRARLVPLDHPGALVLALPEYPRSEGAELGEAIFTEAGLAPMKDEDARPFAGLAALKDQLKPDPE